MTYSFLEQRFQNLMSSHINQYIKLLKTQTTIYKQ